MSDKIHTTVYIERELYKKVKTKMLQEETDLTKLINKLLKDYIKTSD